MLSEGNIMEQIISCNTPHENSNHIHFSNIAIIQSNANNLTPKGQIQQGLTALKHKSYLGSIASNDNKLDANKLDSNKLSNYIRDETISKSAMGSGYLLQNALNSKNMIQSPFIFAQNNATSQKTMVEHSHHQFRQNQKKKSFSLYSTIRWKQFANKWLNQTSFKRFKKLNFHHFNLINDQAIYLSKDSLPNANFQKNAKQMIKQKQKSSFFHRKQNFIKPDSSKQNTIFNEEENDDLLNQSDIYEWRFKDILTVQSFQWSDKWFQWIPVLSPSGKFKFIWDLIILGVITSLLFMIPLEITFDMSLKEMFNSSFVKLCISILVADFFLAWNFGYYEKGLSITKRSQVILNYLKNGITIDVCASIFLVIDIFFKSSNSSNPLHLMFFLKINSIKVIFKKIEERFHLRPTIMQVSSLIQLLFFILTVSHIFGCMWVAVAHMEINRNIKSWINQVEYDPDDWFGQYVCAYHFATVTMITVGYGDFAPVNNTERIVNIASMLISCGVFAYSINAIGDIFSTINLQSKQIKGDLYAISNFMSKKNINQELQYEIREFLEYQWVMQNDRNQSKENQLIDQLSPQLREKLLVETYKVILHQYQIFNDNFSDEFLISMISIMEEYTYRPDEQINFELNDQECDLYFIEQGRVVVYVDENADKIIKILSRGDNFGEIAFFSGQPHSYNIKSTEYSTIIRIRRKKFLALIQTYPVDYEIFCSIQDKLLYSNEYSIIRTQCFSCRSPYHTFKACPYIHLIVNNLSVISKLNIYEFNERKGYQRGNQKFPSIILQQAIQGRLYKYLTDFADDIEAYGEEYLDFEEKEQFPSQLSDIDENQQQDYDRQFEKDENQGYDLKSINSQNNNQLGNLSGDQSSPQQDYLQNISKQQSLNLSRQLSYGKQCSDIQKVSKDSKTHQNVSHPQVFNLNSEQENIDQTITSIFARKAAVTTTANGGNGGGGSKLTIQTVKQNSQSPKSQNSPIKVIQREKKNSLQKVSPNLTYLPFTFSEQTQRQLQPQSNYMNNSMLKQSNIHGKGNVLSAIASSLQIVGDDASSKNKIIMKNSQIPHQTIPNNVNPAIYYNNNNNDNNKIKISQIVEQIVKQYAERDYEGQINNQDDFDRQKNFDFYLPHNNLSMILEYLKYKQKNCKNMRNSVRLTSLHLKSQAHLNNNNNNNNTPRLQTQNNDNMYKDSPMHGQHSQFNSNLISNSRNHHYYRKFQQQKLKQFESKQKRQAMLIKKRKSQKTATTKMQKLIMKYEQISNNSSNLHTESPSGIVPLQKSIDTDVSIVDNINKNISISNKLQIQNNRQSIFFQLNPFIKQSQPEEEEGFEAKDIESCLNQMDRIKGEEPSQQNSQSFLNLRRYYQNKIRFSINSASINQTSNGERKQSQNETTSFMRQLLDFDNKGFQDSVQQNNIDNEDISDTSYSSGKSQGNSNMRETKIFNQIQQNKIYNFHDVSSPLNDLGSTLQLQSITKHYMNDHLNIKDHSNLTIDGQIHQNISLNNFNNQF